MTNFSLLFLFTRAMWVVQKGQNLVYVIIERPLKQVGNMHHSILTHCAAAAEPQHNTSRIKVSSFWGHYFKFFEFSPNI